MEGDQALAAAAAGSAQADGASVVTTALDPHVFGDASPCFGCSPTHPIGLKLKPSLHVRTIGEAKERWVSADFTAHEHYQGPPGVMHGGLVMALADEIAAWTVIGVVERFGFTAQANVKLARPLRIGNPVACTGRVLVESARIVKIGVTLEQSGATVFTGEFTFALLDEASAERLLGSKLPDSWRRFARKP